MSGTVSLGADATIGAFVSFENADEIGEVANSWSRCLHQTLSFF